ncbi:MAG: ATP-binding protein, partial [Thermoproteus sp.]
MFIIWVIITGVIFLDRREELALLRRELKRQGFGLLIIYGRRRVGKTALVLKATEDMRRLYYLAVERGNLPRLKRAAAALDPQARYVEEDWEALFAFLARRVDVVVIDEFPNLIAEDKAVLSTLQAIVDQMLGGTNMKLVLVGSSVSVMTSRVLSYRSPLYGRKTLAMHVKPVPFLEYRRFFPERPAEELVEIHGFAGGVPHYMLKIGKPFWQFLDAELREKTFILDEGDFLLRYEFEDGEIRDYARLKATDITPYLRNLAQAGLIEKTRPVLGRGRYRYRIADRFLNFWFRFINPNRSAIEEGLYTAEDVRREYPQYLGPVFEDVAREVIIEEMRAGRLPCAARLGPQWWARKT